MPDTPMTDARLDEISALADAACDPPWIVVDLRGAPDGNRDCIWVDQDGAIDSDGTRWWRTVAEMTEDEGLNIIRRLEDAQFIAAARTAVPEMAAEIRRLRAAYTGLQALCTREQDRADNAEADAEKWRDEARIAQAQVADLQAQLAAKEA